MRPTTTLQAGEKVRFQDGRTKRTGVVLSYGRSSKHPWNVYLIRPDDGKGQDFAMPNGEVVAAVEVHADRIL